MEDLFRSLALIYRMNFGPTPRVEITQTELGPDRIPADVYHPRTSRPRGTILSVHGMTLFGARDPRIVKLCSTLTVSGHTIVSPHYAEIADLRVDSATIDRLRDTIRAIADDRELRPPSGRIGVLTHSFSAGMTLAAVAQPDTQQRVSVLCSMGGAYNFDTAMQSLLGQQDENHYPRRVMLWNYLRHSIGPRPKLEHAIRVAIEDNGYQRVNPELPQALAALGEEDREFFLRLQNEPEFRLRHLPRFQEAMSPITRALAQIDDVRVPVLIVHGLHDTVVPASQAVEVYQRLRRLNRPARLEVSPLLDHGRPYIGLRVIGPVLRMVRTFAEFFRLTAEARAED